MARDPVCHNLHVAEAMPRKLSFRTSPDRCFSLTGAGSDASMPKTRNTHLWCHMLHSRSLGALLLRFLCWCLLRRLVLRSLLLNRLLNAGPLGIYFVNRILSPVPLCLHAQHSILK